MGGYVPGMLDRCHVRPHSYLTGILLDKSGIEHDIVRGRDTPMDKVKGFLQDTHSYMTRDVASRVTGTTRVP